MKKFYLVCIAMASFMAGNAQVLFTYGKKSVTAGEFMKAYNRNRTDSEKQTSLQEYLDLYINFKLKVEAARALGMDTLPHIRNDIKNFRNQVAQNFLNDPQTMEKLKQEANIRALRDLHISMVSVSLDSGAAKADSLKAISDLDKAVQSLKAGKEAEAPARFTDLGFITVFSLPYFAENLVYGLKEGQFSSPYRTKSALHIFKLEKERPAVGKLRIAQVLLSVPPGAGEAEMAALQKRADSIYKLLENGMDFSAAAKRFSEDKLTYMNGGELPPFGTGEFDQVFERNALLLQQDGDISRPFVSPYGVHILKRISRQPVTDPVFKAAMDEKLKKDQRIKLHESQFLNSIRSKTGFALTNAVKENDLLRYADSIMFRYDLSPSSVPGSSRMIIKYKKGGSTFADWLSFVREYKGNYDAYRGETNRQLLERFYDVSLKEYYAKHLEDYNDDFAYQVKEFSEGNILFEIMEKNIWGFASTDSTGLKDLYESKKTSYVWPESADMIIMNAANEQTANEVAILLERNRDWMEITEAMQGAVQADSGRFEMALLGQGVPASEKVLPRIKNEDGSFTIIKVLKLYPAGEIKSFEDAKGILINDHQDALEAQWVAQLKKKYPVKINQKVLAELK